ncbi:MAG: Gfo/Idh/MocA family oxidoreductase [Chloroflexota bacterium]|nr:MAG: Gfo/Idh/MocA family oxidoreductase [Chloroflexota bacterium]
MSEPLRVAVIGAGGISRLRHIPAYRDAEKLGIARVVAICDPVDAALKETGDMWGIDARYRDWREVVGRSDVDVVSVATPNSGHEPISIAALEAGKHVLCEKPLALDLAGARRMLAAAERSGKKTGVHFRYRYIPGARYMKELIDTGEIGSIHQIYLTYVNGSVQDPASPLRWRMTRAEGGGLLGDLGSHIIDLALWLCGSIVRVNATLKTFTTERATESGGRARIDVDDAATLMVEFANGATGVICASGMGLGRGNYQHVDLYGAKGSVEYEIERSDVGGDAINVCLGPAQHRVVGMARIPVPARHHRTANDPLIDFVRAVRDGVEPAITFADAVRVQEVIEAAGRSHASGSWVPLPLP